MNITLFHYHLEAGGVANVIQQAILALSSQTTSIKSIHILTGHADNALVSALQEKSSIPLTVTVNPVLGYISRIDQSAIVDHKDLAQSIRGILATQVADDTVWWVHNYHIGKNPAFSVALIAAMHTFPRQRVILHVHDFPENGRFALYSVLCRKAGNTLYPILPNVRYVVISTQDREILIKAGIPPRLVFYISNPVSSDNRQRLFSSLDITVQRYKIASAYARSRYQYYQEMPHIIYPVRSIRRKNIMEAGLFLRVKNPNINLIVTLPGISEQEKEYSAIVARAFRNKLITGIWGIGTELQRIGISFDDLFSLCNGVISSSIQEGFGYQYIDALLRRKPLFARFVPPIRDIAGILEHYPNVLYNTFRVPLDSPSLGNISEKMMEHYTLRLDDIQQLNLLTGDVKNKMQNILQSLCRDTMVDFSLLPAAAQYSYLEDASMDTRFSGEIADANRGLMDAFDELLGAGCPNKMPAIIQNFGPQHFAQAFQELIASFSETITFSTPRDVESKIFESFCTINMFSALYA